MLQHGELDSNRGKPPLRSLKNAIWLISRFLLTTQVQRLSGFIDYVVVTLRENAFDFVCPNEVLPNCIFDRITSVPDNSSTIIETVLIDSFVDIRTVTHVPVTVVERWVFQPIRGRSPSVVFPETSHLDRVCDEIGTFCASSSLIQWLKAQHLDRRRYKFTHRICTTCDTAPHLGLPFLMNRSDLTRVFTLYDSDTECRDVSNNSSMIKLTHNASQIEPQRTPLNTHTIETTHASGLETTSFGPVHVSTDSVLNISVTSPKRLSSYTAKPFCAVCGVRSQTGRTIEERDLTREPFTASASTSSMSSWSTSSTSLSSQPDILYPESAHDDLPRSGGWMRSNGVEDPTPGVDLSSADGDSGLHHPYTETVKSPMVVVTDVRESFFSTDTWGNPLNVDTTAFFPHVPPLESEFDVSGSGNSTLTKKSRVVKPTQPSISSHIDFNDQPLESPPRKQQRMVSAERDRPDLLTSDQTKHGTMDKVIDRFTLLNVEKNDTTCSSAPAVLPDKTKPVVFMGSENALEENTSSQADCTSTGTSTSNLGSEQRTGRRRNASSICVGAWPLWNRDTVPFFNRRTGLPLQSSPVPLKRSTSGKFDFDASLCSLKLSKSSTCMVYGADQSLTSPLASSNTSTPSSRTDPITDEKTSSEQAECVASGKPCSQTTTVPNQSRRRPASLRLNVSTPASTSVGLSSSTESNGRHPARRRACPSNADHSYHHHHHSHPTEMSCSAPPSGNRSLHMMTDRMANTMACTPVSHASSQHLLVNFEESMLNGRIHPVGQVDGFSLELGASGSFFPAHARIPMQAYFFDLSDDNTPSPYLGYADLSHLRNGKGYHVPKKGSVQLTLFNPNKLVVKMFVIGYDFEDMPPNSQTFLRQRTVYMPIKRSVDHMGSSAIPECHTEAQALIRDGNPDDRQSSALDRRSVPDLFWVGHGTQHGGASETESETRRPLTDYSSDLSASCSCSSHTSSTCSLASGTGQSSQPERGETQNQPAFLRYLVHLRFHTTRSGRLFLHTDLRLIFARDKFEFDPRVATYELRSFVDAPSNPRYSPKKWTKPRVNRTVGTPANHGPFVPHISMP